MLPNRMIRQGNYKPSWSFCQQQSTYEQGMISRYPANRQSATIVTADRLTGLTFCWAVELIGVADDRQRGWIRHLSQSIQKFPTLHQQYQHSRQHGENQQRSDPRVCQDGQRVGEHLVHWRAIRILFGYLGTFTPDVLPVRLLPARSYLVVLGCLLAEESKVQGSGSRSRSIAR